MGPIVRMLRLLLAPDTAPRRPASRRPRFDLLEGRVVPSATNYVGFAYGPYVGQWITGRSGKQPPAFNAYGSGNWSVQKQIDLLGAHTAEIATYSAGYAGYYKPTTPWNQVDSAWRVGGAAAAFNKHAGRLALTISQGIYQQVQNGGILNPLMTAEIDGAFHIAKNANATFAGTVRRLVFTNEYVTDATTTTQVDHLVEKYKAEAHKLGLQVGVRSNTFGQLTNAKSSYLTQLQKLVKDVDFIMLNLYPSSEAKGTAAGAADVESQYRNIKAAALKVNPKVHVLIGETGWPTQGISFNDLTGKHNTVANARAYYNAIAKWADANKVETFYFEGIDEPWKSNLNQQGGNPWTGPDGAEGHYGLWMYNTSTPDGRFVSKWLSARRAT